MHRILLVEDQSLTREELAAILREKFPNAEVETAVTEAEARAKLESFDSDERKVDVVLLDMKIPQDNPQGNPEISDLREIAHNMFPEALIGHISAHFTDDAVQSHNKRLHLSSRVPTCFWIDKEAGWTRRVIGKVAGRIIEQQLPEETRDMASRLATMRRAGPRHDSGTYRRAALAQDIASYWQYLEPELQERLQRYFVINKKIHPVTVR